MESNKQKFKRLRADFRENVFKRDGHKCIFCNITEGLDAHHIVDRHEMPNDGYTIWNGASLCSEHHIMAEEFHINAGKSWEPGFHPDDLYKIIGSSYERAVEESEKLT